MKRWPLLAMLLVCLIAGPTAAADPPTNKPVAAKKATPLPAKWSIAENGRYHAVHKAEDLKCSDCHSTENVDPLFLRAGESQGRLGPVDRAGCMDCHRSPKKPTWYQGTKKSAGQ